MANSESWPTASETASVGGPVRPNPFVEIDELDAGATAIVLAVRVAGPLPQAQLYHAGVVGAGTLYGHVPELVEAGILARRPVKKPTGGHLLWDPATQDPPASQLRLHYPECADSDPDALADCADLSVAKVAVLLAVRLAGPLAQADLHGHEVLESSTVSLAAAGLVSRGVLECTAIEDRPKTRLLYDPTRQSPERVMTDGGRKTDHADDRTKVTVRAPGPMIDAIDDVVDTGLYQHRSEAVRSGIRRELRVSNPNRDDLSRLVQELYECILAGQRPEAIAQCEVVAEQLGMSLSRRAYIPEASP